METSHLIQQIVEGCTSDVPISSLLRKAKLLSHRLKVQGLGKWADEELGGYPEECPIPDYRFYHGDLYIDVQNLAWRATQQLISKPVLDKAIGKKRSDDLMACEARDPIAVIEEISTGDSGKYAAPFPVEVAAKISPLLNNGYHCTSVYKISTRRQFTGIVDQIRTRLLSHMIELDELVQSKSDAAISSNSEIKKEMEKSFIVNIYGGSNVVGSESDLINSLNVQMPSSAEDLLRTLRELNVPAAEVDDLTLAIQEDDLQANKNLGNRVKSWLGNAAVSIANGTWDVSSALSAQILAELIMKAYGIGAK